MDRKRKDLILNIITYLCSSFSIIVLLGLIIFLFSRGIGNLSFNMLTKDYYETPYFAYVEESSSFDLFDKDGIYYSKNFGIGLKDSYDLEKNAVVEIAYIDNLSPLKNAISHSGGRLEVKVGQIIKRIQVKNGEEIKIETQRSGAEAMRDALDFGSEITELYYLDMGGGIRGSLLSTLYLIGLTLIIVMPIGIIAAIYLALYAKQNTFVKVLRSLIDMISGIPSIIFGLIAIIVFIPIVSGITNNNGGSIISGALTLSVMLLPTVIRTTEEAINNIPKSYKSASLALGASETQTTFKVILPNALPGILTSILLCIGRIIGESAALIFAIGTAIQDQIDITKGSTTLAVHIWSVKSGENPNYGQACAISLIILMIVLLLNILVKLVSKKLNKFEVKQWQMLLILKMSIYPKVKSMF